MKRKYKWLCVGMVLILTLVGCSPKPKVKDTTIQKEGEKKDQNDKESIYDKSSLFPKTITNKGTPIEGGVLKAAIVSSSAFAGVLNPLFCGDMYDIQIISYFTEPIISYDENFVQDQDGACTYEYDKEKKTITLHLKEGITWQDGEPLTLDDLVFAMEVLCHKDYDGIYFGEGELNIEGVKEYHDGKADQISGLELSKDKMNLTIHFIDFYPSILVGGFWSTPLPRHYYKGISVKEMAAHEKTRKHPLGYGPFKVKNIVPGESVELVRFDDYWRGKPKLDGVEMQVINPELVPAAMKEGKFDVAEFSTQQYPDYKDPANYQYLGEIATTFSYTGFKLGKWDDKKKENITDSNKKMANVNLRKAIGYAVDNETIGKTLYNGLRFLATSIMTPRHVAYFQGDQKGYYFDPEKAKKLLDEAGYKDVDGDGLREDPKGNPLTITWATMEGENGEAFAQYKIQCWKDVGLKVELYNGRLTEFNAFYEAIESDDPKIDMYDAAWQTGYDPNPAALWGAKSSSNMTRYTSENFNHIIGEISSMKGWDNEFLRGKYKEWQEAFFEEVPAIPTLWRMELVAVNNRVKNMDTVPSDIKQTIHLIELTAEEPMK